ncbi:MAG: hypothetical protein KatS3mg111_3230 [Pirellulaceae bacterium]|nr:MAG: hypothetical protein KatS3mg111_3230 [Pirellulaceae bacterium]
MKRPCWLPIVVWVTMHGSLLAQSRSTEGAAVGGAAGAIIGGIIGHQNDEVPEGALIGGALGAIGGALLGRSKDEEIARQQWYAQQQAYAMQQQRQAQAAVNGAVSPSDLVQMVRSGLSEPLIVSQLHLKGVPRRLEVAEIISLHQQGVTDTLITAYQQAPLAGHQVASSPSATPVTPPPVTAVERTVIVPRPVVVDYYPFPSWHHHHHYHCPPRRPVPRGSSVSLFFGF